MDGVVSAAQSWFHVFLFFHRRLEPKDGALRTTYLPNVYSEPEQCNIVTIKKTCLHIAYMTKANTENDSSRTDTSGPKKDTPGWFLKNNSKRYETKKCYSQTCLFALVIHIYEDRA